MTDDIAAPPLVANPGENKLRKLLGQFLKYCLVGGFAFCVDFGTLLLLNEVFDVDYRVAGAIGFLLGLIVNYAISVIWVFDTHSLSNRYVEFLIYALVGVFGLIVNDQVLYFCTEMLNFRPSLSKIPAAAIVLLLNFTLRKYLLFQARE